MDFAGITSIIGAATGIVGEITKAIKAKKYDDINTSVIDLQSIILQLQPAIFELQSENNMLKEEIAKLKDNKELEKEFEYPPGKSYILHKKGNAEIKLCTTCWNTGHQYTVLSEPSMPRNPLFCSKCNTLYK